MDSFYKYIGTNQTHVRIHNKELQIEIGTLLASTMDLIDYLT